MPNSLIINTEKCIGCGTCVELCSNVFSFNENEDKIEIIMQEGGYEDCIEEAIESCPAECISYTEDECVACETCTSLCSEVFAFNESEEMAEVVSPIGGPRDCMEEARGSCPEDCLSWEDDE
jgi:ferredoxin